MGREGWGPLGCFCRSKSQTSGVLGATPGDTRAWQAFPSNPPLLRPIAEKTSFWKYPPENFAFGEE